MLTCAADIILEADVIDGNVTSKRCAAGSFKFQL